MSSRVLVALRIDAAPARVFEAFTAEIGQWWRTNPLFQPTRRSDGTLSLEPGDDGRLLVTYADGAVDEIGRLRVWEPPDRLVVTWCPTSFSAESGLEAICPSWVKRAARTSGFSCSMANSRSSLVGK